MLRSVEADVEADVEAEAEADTCWRGGVRRAVRCWGGDATSGTSRGVASLLPFLSCVVSSPGILENFKFL
ncbi:MAG: hypothetical protein ABGY24_17775 [bacterium]